MKTAFPYYLLGLRRLLGLLGLLGLLWPSAALAYPAFQLSTGAARCSSCHMSPAGGGLLTSYGRQESADTISNGGNGDFLHGLVGLPKWLSFGGDFRFATLVNEAGGSEGTKLAFFPMQADLYTAVRAGAWSLHFTVGMRGSVRGEATAPLDRFISREHYLMWRPRETGAYVRAGKFFPLFGLRLAEHIVYLRRYLGLDTLAEPYAAAFGWLDDKWELHATAYIADFLRPVGERASGGAIYYERRLGEEQHAAVGGQIKIEDLPESWRAMGGFFGKLYIERARLVLLGETDLVRQTLPGNLPGRTQWVIYAGANFFLRQGLLLGASYERFDEDLSVRNVARDAFMAQLQWFPTAHVELALYGRAQVIGGGDGGAPSELLMFQFHYYL